MRIYTLAKKLGIDSKELMERLKGLNFPVKSHMSSVDDETAEIIRHEVEDLKRKEIESNVIEVDFPISVKDLAVKLGKEPSEILKVLMGKGKFVTINNTLDEDTASSVAYFYKVTLKKKTKYEDKVFKIDSSKLAKRAPVVTLMGHIDHGKTSILDYIRKSKIADKETGGITQHIGAYRIESPKGDITFIDTPGHEAFTAMRARGANATDIVVLVVAADEGVKPQTVEAIDHARATNTPIIVAINKIDKPNADIDMVKQGLSRHELVPEDWGGKTVVVGVSAKTGKGIDELLDMIILQAEIMELKASYEQPAVGVVIEARLSRGRGPVVAALIQQGVLKQGDVCVSSIFWGKIRALHNDRGKTVDRAYPSYPIEVIGLNGLPSPGDHIFVVPDEKKAKEITSRRKEEEKIKTVSATHIRLVDLHKKIEEDKLKQLKLILKADVGGTLEAVEESLRKFSSDEVKINFIHKGVGLINYSDVLLAEVSDAIIAGFKVNIEPQAKEYARKKGIEVRIYHIVYELINDVKSALEGLFAPQIKRIFVGRAKVKEVFKLSKAGVIAGCVVEKGKIVRAKPCDLIRDSEVVTKSTITSLKRFKDDVREVGEGMECGIGIDYGDIKPGDYIDMFLEEKIERKL